MSLKMKSYILVAAIAAICWQIASGNDTCPYAIAPDGTTYDLSFVAYQTLQYHDYINGIDYTFNISLCGVASQHSCGGTWGTAGVCQSWNQPRPSSKCYGQVYTRAVKGFNYGAGVQIIYYDGDTCGSCNPSGPRTSVITLTCDSFTPRGQVSWTSIDGGQPGMPPVVYFNGTMHCDFLGQPSSAPNPTSTPSASWTGCRNINAPDGSTYDLSALMDRDFSTLTYSAYDQQYSNISFAVCGGISGFCGNGACKAWRSASVCQLYEPLDVEKCFGQYNLDTTMEGLNFGEGVIITYNDGDKCDGCSPRGPRKTILTLNCNSYYFPSELYVTSVSTDLYSSVLAINATIGCTPATPPQSSPQPWWGPQPYWSPQPNLQPPYVTIQYVGYGTGCNGSDAYMVTVNRTWSCYPGCYLQGNKYVMTDCDDDIFLPRGGSWVETIYYGDSYYCDTPRSAVYVRSNTCTGNFNFSYQECDPNTVYTYTCNSPYCNQCSMTSKPFTENCNYGTLYRCVSDYAGKSHLNPLL